MTAITVLKENVPQGPFTRSEVADRLNRGEFTLDSLAFVEGLSQWTPLRDVLAKVDGASQPPPAVSFAPAPPALVAAAPAAYTTSPSAAAPFGPGPAYSYAATMQPPEHLVYAGFWLRVAAIFIDGLILSPLAIISLIFNFMLKSEDNTMNLVVALAALVYSIFALVVRWLYFALQESSGAQATLGKRLLGIQVTDRQGQRIGFGRATGRFFGKIVSAITFCIGFMMAGWTQRKQALHDMLADTLVVRKPGA
jgi:uncharacterized RDD family membrane protein YckC